MRLFSSWPSSDSPTTDYSSTRNPYGIDDDPAAWPAAEVGWELELASTEILKNLRNGSGRSCMSGAGWREGAPGAPWGADRLDLYHAGWPAWRPAGKLRKSAQFGSILLSGLQAAFLAA